MSDIFLRIVNMSICAGWLVLAVLVLRLLLKKAPKWVNVLLWGLVAVRLLSPFSVESSLSLIPDLQFETRVEVIEHQTVGVGQILDSRGNLLLETELGAVPHAFGQILDEDGNVLLEAPLKNTANSNAQAEQDWVRSLAMVWVLGMVLMGSYTLLSYLYVKRKVLTAVLIRKGICQSEYVNSPFLLGVFRPVIYLPYGMDENSIAHVIAHEQAHIRRKDHWWKPLGFLLLTVHWFNPLMWVAYILLCRDIELACDEKVISELTNEQRADYTKALVSCSIRRLHIAACPLAFGEVGVKIRVRSIMNYRKPGFWIMVTALMVCAAAAVCFLTDPVSSRENGNPGGDITLEAEAFSANVTEMRLRNLHNGKDTVIRDPDAIREVVNFLQKVQGTNETSSRGYYGGCYEFQLFAGDKEVFSIGFGDDESYNFGDFGDGYPARYEMRGMTTEDVIRFLSQYDSSGYDWELSTSVMYAKLLEFHDGYYTVEPVEGSWERSSASKIEVPMKNMEPSPEPQLGDILEIEYDGQLQETYPARIGKVYGIRVAEETEAEFEVNFAGNTSLQMKMELTEERPYWWIGVDNRGTESIVVEVGGEVHKIGPETYVLYSEEKWDPKTYMVSFASTGASGMAGSAVCYKYKYRMEITGRLNNAVSDITYIVLSNLESITFDQVWKASGLSSNLDDYFDPADAVIIGAR